MRIDKARKQAMSPGVVMPVMLVIAVTIFATTLADVSDDAFGHFYRSVFYDAELSHFRTFTGGGSCRGDNTGIEYNQVFTH